MIYSHCKQRRYWLLLVFCFPFFYLTKYLLQHLFLPVSFQMGMNYQTLALFHQGYGCFLLFSCLYLSILVCLLWSRKVVPSPELWPSDSDHLRDNKCFNCGTDVLSHQIVKLIVCVRDKGFSSDQNKEDEDGKPGFCCSLSSLRF